MEFRKAWGSEDSAYLVYNICFICSSIGVISWSAVFEHIWLLNNGIIDLLWVLYYYIIDFVERTTPTLVLSNDMLREFHNYLIDSYKTCFLKDQGHMLRRFCNFISLHAI